MECFKLTGSTALITGAGTGIGRATALCFAEAGANVVVAARTQSTIDAVAEECRKFGVKSIAVATDITRPQDLDRLVSTTVEHFGGIDILINNAGGAGAPMSALDITDEYLAELMHFNLTSRFGLMRRCIPHLLERKNASVVTTSSVLGRMPDPGFVTSNTINAALSHMTRSLATEFAPLIRFNAIEVGATLTEALKPLLEHGTLAQQMTDKTPMQRLGTAEDIAYGALYLCSPAASWVTGKILEIDGGQLSTNWPIPMNHLSQQQRANG